MNKHRDGGGVVWCGSPPQLAMTVVSAWDKWEMQFSPESSGERISSPVV